MNKLFENTAAMFVILKLIETCAGGCQEHDVPFVSRLRGKCNGVLQRSRPPDGYATIDLFFDFVRGRSYKQREYSSFSKQSAQLRIVAVFIFAAQNNDDSSGKRLKCL